MSSKATKNNHHCEFQENFELHTEKAISGASFTLQNKNLLLKTQDLWPSGKASYPKVQEGQ
jgi:hypothetical protein